MKQTNWRKTMAKKSADIINLDGSKEQLESETGETASVELTTAETGNNEIATPVEVICSGCNDLDVDELKEVIEYCSSRIDELQQEEVEALEAEMRAIQDKLMAMRGYKNKPMKTESKERSRTEKVVINPDNPTQVYKFGKTPDWLTALCAKTGKTVSELRVDQPV